MCAFHRWGQVKLTMRTEASCRTAVQGTVSDARPLHFTHLRGLHFMMPHLGMNAQEDAAGQLVPRLDRFYANVAHSHTTFGSPSTSQKAGRARTAGQGNNARGLRSDPVQNWRCLLEPDGPAFVHASNQ